MSKFALLLCFLLAVNYSMCQNTELVDKYYDYLVGLLKGLSIDGSNKCATFFEVKRNEVIKLIKSAMVDIEGGGELSTIALQLVNQLLRIDSSVATTCNLLGIIPLISKFNSADEIKAIGDRISSKSRTIFQLIQSIKESKDLKTKLLYIGKILSIILNFNVY